jgi:DNA-binding response OmpR family regulator
MGRRVLIIEDDQDIAHLVKLHLEDIDCDVEIATDGKRGLERAQSGEHDLLILDLMLPGIDGLEICRRVRAAADYTPILMLTARDSEVDRVLGLELGADDYLTKPFSVLELVARVKALFRRIDILKSLDERDAEAAIRLADLTIEPDKRQVQIRGETVELTAKEFDLLVHFARQPGRVFSRSQLLDSVWGYGHAGYEHTVNSHINRLRSKIEDDPAQPKYILTVWGIGYRFAELPTEAAKSQEAHTS